MSKSLRIILEMLANKKISVDDAEKLIKLNPPEAIIAVKENSESGDSAKYLHIVIEPVPGNNSDSQENFNIRVPTALLRAGIKLASVLPTSVYNQLNLILQEKGIEIDLKTIKPENIEELVGALSNLDVNILKGTQHFHIYTE
jgi:hypothetical protein